MTRAGFLPILLALCPLSAFAADSLYLDLSAKGEKTSLGLSEFATEHADVREAAQAREIRDVVKNDLAATRLFSLIEGGAPPLRKKIFFASWTRLGADVLCAGEISALSGRVHLTGTLYDTSTGKVLVTKTFTAPEDLSYRAAHQWSDEVVRYFTGQPGVASSRIAFVNDATGKKEVCVIDYDGGHFRRLTDDRSIALFPKFSPDGEWIAYTTFRNGSPDIYVMRSDGSDKRPLCRYEGLNSAAAWMPDGKSLVATLSLGRDPNLYVVDLTGRVLRALTNSFSADTAPAASPDGLRLAFTSDRPGPPQIYVMDANGANMRRLTAEGQCDSPGWSPQGDRLVFTQSLFRGNYDIYILEAATGRQSRLTFGEGDNENASWSPDGRFVVFASTRRGKSELWIMGSDGSNPRPLATLPGRSFTPHWGN